MRPRAVRPRFWLTILAGSGLGVLLMSAASVLQKFVMGMSPDEVLEMVRPRSLLIPVSIGLLGGGALALVWYRTQVLADEARLASIVRHIGDISHDVKNLMTPVESGALTLQMLAEDAFASLDRDLASCADKELVEKVGSHLAALRGFLPQAVAMAVSGSEAAAARAREIADAVKGEVAEPHFRMTDINDVARSAVGALAVLANTNGTSIDVSGLEDVPHAQLDPKLMHSAVYNLLNNAIPATPGGTIAVRTRTETPDQAAPARLVIEVDDNGRGMPEMVRKSLFTDAAISTKPGGTGLGTRIVQSAVRAHGGDIAVVSTEGKGTRFTIRLPIRAAETEGHVNGEDDGSRNTR